MVNNDTSQTLDYKLVKEVQEPDNEASLGGGADLDDEGAGKAAATITYVAGRIFFDTRIPNGKWVYESFNHCFSSEKFDNGDVAAHFAGIYQRSEQEFTDQAQEIRDARSRVIANEEERKIQAAASAAKKKAPSKNANKKDTSALDDDKRDDDKKGPPPKKALDKNFPNDFGEILKDQIPRPFVFGPIEFNHLDQEAFPAAEWTAKVVQALNKAAILPDNHGFQVTIKNKTMKRATSIVKHSRFLRNMVVYPIYPPEPDLTQVPILEKTHEEEEDE